MIQTMGILVFGLCESHRNTREVDPKAMQMRGGCVGYEKVATLLSTKELNL